MFIFPSNCQFSFKFWIRTDETDAFFDKLMLYPDHLRDFIERGGILAWGIVPTLNSDDIEKETTESIVAKWEDQVGEISALGIEKSTILAQTLITPSCGTGSLSIDLTTKVLSLTRDISDILREKFRL